MYSRHENLILSDSKFFSYFVPKKLREEKIFPVTTFSFEKNEIEVEAFHYTISDLQQSFLLCLENRFWTYNKTPFFENQEFSLCFQSLDKSSKTLLFSKRKKRLSGYSSFSSFVKESEELLKRPKSQVLMKSRLLRLTRGGFSSSCLGNPAFVLRSSSFYRFRKHSSYKGWFSLNLPYYGLLSYFSLIRFEKKFLSFAKNYQKKFLSQRAKFYYLKNKRMKYFFLLGKPKILQLTLYNDKKYTKR
jgi:hypothetical protein